MIRTALCEFQKLESSVLRERKGRMMNCSKSASGNFHYVPRTYSGTCLVIAVVCCLSLTAL